MSVYDQGRCIERPYWSNTLPDPSQMKLLFKIYACLYHFNEKNTLDIERIRSVQVIPYPSLECYV